MKKWRVNLIFIIIFLFGAAIISRLFYLQVTKYDYYKALAQGQQSFFDLSKGERGKIFFSGGEILAVNLKENYVFVSPSKIENKEETAKTLSAILSSEESSVLEKIKKEDSSLVKIKSGLTKKEEADLLTANLPGVYVGDAILRKYPQKSMASQTVGFVGGEGAGQYGVEAYYEDILCGKEFFQKGERGASAYFFAETDDRAANGADIFLTLDYNIQFKAESLLEKAKKDLDIEGGTIIVSDPYSGKIMALANYPNFDLNSYSENKDFHIFQNPALQKIYEPGSIFKPITMASALDKGKITPQTTYVDEGKVKIGSDTIYNYGKRVWGKQSMTEVLEKSINSGAIFAERQAGHDNFLAYVAKFGFFEPTGIDLAGEVSSENQELKRGYETNLATAAFGQGIEITPLQLIRAFSAIANGGKLVKPYITEKIVKGTQVTETEPSLSQNYVISPETASTLTTMMVSVIENGFAKTAKVPGYYLAGKTGTSQVSYASLGENRKGYSEKTWQSFIGFGPAFDPKFLILIKLDNPKASTSEYSASPIFQELSKYLTDYMQIPPDYQPGDKGNK